MPRPFPSFYTSLCTNHFTIPRHAVLVYNSASRSVSFETVVTYMPTGYINRSSNQSIYTPLYIQQDTTLNSLLYLETALHVLGVTSTHHQERIQLYLQDLVFVTPLLLPAAIVEDFHPSSGAHTTVSTASGICHTVTATCR